MQLKAAEIAAARDIRPEAKQFAQEMTAFRKSQLQRIEGFAAQNNATMPKELAFAHPVSYSPH